MSNGVSAKLLSLFLFHLFLSCISSISVFREKGLERESYKMWYCWTISLNAVKKSCKGWSEWYYRYHRNKYSGQTVACILQLWNVDVTSNEERFSSRKTYSAQLKTGSTDYKSGFSIFRIIINNLRLSFASMTVGDSKKYPLVYEFSGGRTWWFSLIFNRHHWYVLTLASSSLQGDEIVLFQFDPGKLVFCTAARMKNPEENYYFSAWGKLKACVDSCLLKILCSWL